MTPCTWTPECPDWAEHRLERRDRGDVVVVETVCTRHVENARDAGYVRVGAVEPDRQETS